MDESHIRDMVVSYRARRESGFLFETFRGPREEARTHARTYFDRYPKGGYMTAVDNWREVDDGEIVFTMRRLPSAD